LKAKNIGIFLTIALSCALAGKASIANTSPLEGTRWKLTGWTAESLVKETEITAAFQKNILSGSAGCNQYNTGYQVKNGTLEVNQAIATTRKACPEAQMKQESQYLAALQGVEQFQVTEKGILQLFYRTPEGLGILTFNPAPQTTRTEKTLYINSRKQPCTQSTTKDCLQIREKPEENWKLLANPIEGFDYKPGFLYQIKVSIETISNPAANQNSETWKLVEIISQSPEKETPRAWFDRPLTNWNKAKASIPKSPVKTVIDNQCREQVRPPITPIDQALNKAGWLLYGAVQTYGKTTVVSAMSAVDGMCRPMGYQDFVFVDGKFAGTLSPRPMDSRTDGASQRIVLQNSDRIIVVFNRYKDTDPLCCPSQLSRVIYQIEIVNGVPIVVPKEVETEAVRN
jgi:heat shock protein HslJ